MQLVMGEGGRMTVIGLALGLMGGVAVDRLLRTMLVGVTATDLPTFLGVSAMLGLVAAGACLLPARRNRSIAAPRIGGSAMSETRKNRSPPGPKALPGVTTTPA